jgi:hypothetical protein
VLGYRGKPVWLISAKFCAFGTLQRALSRELVMGPGDAAADCDGPSVTEADAGARSVGRAFFIGDAKVIALSRCARRSGICTISYCVPG